MGMVTKCGFPKMPLWRPISRLKVETEGAHLRESPLFFREVPRTCYSSLPAYVWIVYKMSNLSNAGWHFEKARQNAPKDECIRIKDPFRRFQMQIPNAPAVSGFSWIEIESPLPTITCSGYLSEEELALPEVSTFSFQFWARYGPV